MSIPDNAEDKVKNPEDQADIEKLETLEDLDPSKKTDEHVPLKKYMSEKAARKEAQEYADKLEQDIATLKSNMVGMSVGAVTDELKRMATEYNVDEAFLGKLMAVAKRVTKEEIKAELDQEYAPKLNKLEQEKVKEQAERKFNELLSKTLGELPEYKELVNPEIIKQLAFNPANAKKTLPQILDEVYGSVAKTKKSIETSRPGREPEAPDFARGSVEDFEKINASPEARKEWAKQTEENLRKYL